MKPSTKAKNKYNAVNYDHLHIVAPKGKKDKIKRHILKHKYESINSFVNQAIEEKINNDNASTSVE